MKCPNCNTEIDVQQQIPDSHKPISMWGYFGYELLFSIPVVGFIILIVFALGGAANVNLRNFARSYFCYMILVLIVAVIIFVTIFAAGGAAYLSQAM